MTERIETDKEASDRRQGVWQAILNGFTAVLMLGFVVWRTTGAADLGILTGLGVAAVLMCIGQMIHVIRH